MYVRMYVRMYVCMYCMYIHMHAFTLIGCNTAARALTDTDAQSQGCAALEGSVNISVKPQAHPCYNLHVTLSIVVYGITHN